MKKKARGVKEDSTLPPTDRFIARYKNYRDYYILLLVIAGIAVAVATVIALFENVLLGMALALLAWGVYKVCSADEAKKQLGITVSHESGQVLIKKAVACYGEELVIPRRFEFAAVTKIGDRAFDSDKNDGLRIVYLPVGITYVGESVFGEERPLPEIHFEGTEEQWNKIEIHTDLSGAVIFFNVPCPIPPSKRKKKSVEPND